MKQENIDWLKGLGPQATAQDQDDTNMHKKHAVLSKLAGDVELLRGQMIENSKIEVRDKSGKTQKIVNYEVRDQTTEFDMDEMREGYALGPVIDPEKMKQKGIHEELDDTADMEKHLQTKRIVETMIRQLEEENPGLFDKEDLIEEVYQPLLRQGLIGETFIPNEFSQTKEMLDKTFEDYGKRLKEAKSKDLWDENKDLVFAGIGLVIGGAGAGTNISASAQYAAHGGATSSWGPQAWTANINATNFDKTVNTGTVANTGVSYDSWLVSAGMLLKDADEDMPKIGPLEKQTPGRISLAPKIAQAVAAGLASQLGTELADAGLGLAGSSSFGAVVKVSAIATQLGGKDFAKGNVDSVCNLVSAAYVEVMAVIDPGGDHTVSQQLTKAGADMQKEYKSALAVDEITKALQESEAKKLDAGNVIQLFMKAGTEALKAGKPLIQPLIQDPGTQKKITDKVNKKLSDDFLKEDSDRDKKAKEELEDLKTVGDIKTEASRIDKKIKILQREQALLKWGFGVANLGMSVASQVLAPLAIAGSAMGIAQNLLEAGKRARDALVFIESRKGMLHAASAYSSAVDNFVGNANLQLLHYSVNAAFQVASMIGSILQCTGILAAAGAAVSASAGISSALEAVLYAAKKRMDLETAWKEYKLALSRPENRKLGLMAIKANPTLAKYAVAWGAVVKKDPLVKDFIHDCGLDAESIEKSTTTDDVVKYLEARMPDDNTVDGRKVPSADFAPSPIVLTAECWASAKARGVAKAHLMPKDTRSLDSALAQFSAAAGKPKTELEELDKKVKAATPPQPTTAVAKNLIADCDTQIQACEKAIQTCQDLLALVKKGFEGYVPVQIDDKGEKIGEHTKMRAVMGDFFSLVDDETHRLDKKADEVKAQKDLVAKWVKA